MNKLKSSEKLRPFDANSHKYKKLVLQDKKKSEIYIPVPMNKLDQKLIKQRWKQLKNDPSDEAQM